MKLYIDDIYTCEVEDIGVSFLNDDIEDVESLKTGKTTDIAVPITPETRKLFGYADNIHTERFNNAYHTARVEDVDTVITEGFACLNSIDTNFNITIIGQGKVWADWASSHKLSEITGYTLNCDASSIVTAWNDPDSAIQMFPVERYLEHEMTLADLHPFFNVRTILYKIFTDAGYTLDSAFLFSILSNKYFSGKIAEQKPDELKNGLGFKAGKATTQEYTVSSLTDTDVSLVDNTTLEDMFNSGSFSMVGLMPTFTNIYADAVALRFRLSMSFQTEVKYDGSVGYIRTPKYFKEFTFLDNKKTFEYESLYFPITPVKRRYNNLNFDNYLWQTGLGGQNVFFSLTLSDVTPSDGYLVQVYGQSAYNGTWGWYIPSYLQYEKELQLNTEYILNVEHASKITNLTFVVLRRNGSTYTPTYDADFSMVIRQYTNDGAMIKFDVDITSKEPHTVAPSESVDACTFTFWQAGTDNLKLIIDKSIYLEPIFNTVQLGIGSVISPLNCLMYDDTQADFIRAVKHLYNLRFVTDEYRKRVYVQPRTLFYDGPVIDWSGKMTSERPLIEELGIDTGRKMSLFFRDEDDLVQSYNDKNPIYGKKVFDMSHKYADSEDYEIENPMFSASLNVINRLGMNVLSVDNDTNFSCRFVHYASLVTEAIEGMYPSESKYPYVTFRDTNVNCGFDGVGGLSDYYLPNVAAYNSGRRITANINLQTKDIEGFARPTDLKRDFRAIYKLNIGDDVLCYVETIDNFTKGKPTKCTFITK